jgi:hypothetical protein
MNDPAVHRIGGSTIGHFCGGEINCAQAEVRASNALDKPGINPPKKPFVQHDSYAAAGSTRERICMPNIRPHLIRI